MTYRILVFLDIVDELRLVSIEPFEKLITIFKFLLCWLRNYCVPPFEKALSFFLVFLVVFIQSIDLPVVGNSCLNILINVPDTKQLRNTRENSRKCTFKRNVGVGKNNLDL